jgi:hypothetical protein
MRARSLPIPTHLMRPGSAVPSTMRTWPNLWLSSRDSKKCAKRATRQEQTWDNACRDVLVSFGAQCPGARLRRVPCISPRPVRPGNQSRC